MQQTADVAVRPVTKHVPRCVAGWGIKRSLAYQLLAENKIKGVSLPLIFAQRWRYGLTASGRLNGFLSPAQATRMLTESVLH